MTKPVALNEQDIKCCLTRVKPLLLAESSLLNVGAPCKIVGDIHGQFSDLVRLLECGGYPPENTYIFLGDYVDRGSYGLEVVVLLLCYKIKYPDKMYTLLRAGVRGAAHLLQDQVPG